MCPRGSWKRRAGVTSWRPLLLLEGDLEFTVGLFFFLKHLKNRPELIAKLNLLRMPV